MSNQSFGKGLDDFGTADAKERPSRTLAQEELTEGVISAERELMELLREIWCKGALSLVENRKKRPA